MHGLQRISIFVETEMNPTLHSLGPIGRRPTWLSMWQVQRAMVLIMENTAGLAGSRRREIWCGARIILRCGYTKVVLHLHCPPPVDTRTANSVEGPRVGGPKCRGV